MWNTAAVAEKQYGGSNKIINRIIWSSNSASVYIPKRTKSRDSNRYLYNYAYSSIIYSSQNIEAINGWMDKQNTLHAYNGIYSVLKRSEILIHGETLKTRIDFYRLPPLPSHPWLRLLWIPKEWYMKQWYGTIQGCMGKLR